MCGGPRPCPSEVALAAAVAVALVAVGKQMGKGVVVNLGGSFAGYLAGYDSWKLGNDLWVVRMEPSCSFSAGLEFGRWVLAGYRLGKCWG